MTNTQERLKQVKRDLIKFANSVNTEFVLECCGSLTRKHKSKCESLRVLTDLPIKFKRQWFKLTEEQKEALYRYPESQNFAT